MRTLTSLLFGVALLGSVANAAPELATVRASFRSSESVLLDRHGEPLHELRTDPTRRRLEWVPLDRVSPALVAAVIAAEDRRFREHGGVDWLAFLGAAWDNLARRPAPRREHDHDAACGHARRAPARGDRRLGASRKSGARRAPHSRSNRAGARRRSSRPISTSSRGAASCRAWPLPRAGSSTSTRAVSIAKSRRCSPRCCARRTPRRRWWRVAPAPFRQRGRGAGLRAARAARGAARRREAAHPRRARRRTPSRADDARSRRGRDGAHDAGRRPAALRARRARPPPRRARRTQRRGRRDHRARQLHRRRARLRRLERRPVRRKRGRRDHRPAPGGLDAQAVPVRRRDRTPLPHCRIASRRCAAPRRDAGRALRAAELRPLVQGHGLGAHGAWRIAQRAGSADTRRRRGRGIPRAAACTRAREPRPAGGALRLCARARRRGRFADRAHERVPRARERRRVGGRRGSSRRTRPGPAGARSIPPPSSS